MLNKNRYSIHQFLPIYLSEKAFKK